MVHVKAHNGEEGNEGADGLAVRGCFDPRLEDRPEWVFKGWLGHEVVVEDDLADFDVSTKSSKWVIPGHSICSQGLGLLSDEELAEMSRNQMFE